MNTSIGSEFSEESYQKELDWLFLQMPNYQIDGKKAYKPGLENIKKLCNFFGNPQNKIKTIHIGGTNGKGSTSNMLASVLQEAGYKVGLYNSPHLVDFTERIKINGKNCDKKFVFDFIQKLKNLPSDIRPSFFEFTTIMAFEYFYQQNIDFAIIEVGLGGRLDSTNIIQPLVSAITNIALDHTDILGNTIEKIALEKAGIIKTRVSIVCGDENPIAKEIIKEKANKENSKFIDATEIRTTQTSDLKGKYQVKNIKVALALVQELIEKNVKISDEQLQRGLNNVQRNTNFIGRWFVFSEQPLTICDTGHNQAGLEEVFAQLNTISKQKHIVLGFVNDKKIDDVMRLIPKDSMCYFVKPNINRGRHPKDYEALLIENNLKYQIFDDVNSGYKIAKTNCNKDEMIFIGGSNFVIGDFLQKNLSDLK